jgi:hypothetical protein
MGDSRQIRKGLPPELLEVLSPEWERKREEDYRKLRERRESMERHLAEAKRLRDSLER